MRILEENSDKSLKKIILYLTLSEALEMKDSISSILKDSKNNHAHIADANCEKEITICIYDDKDLEGYNERSKRLILNNE